MMVQIWIGVKMERIMMKMKSRILWMVRLWYLPWILQRLAIKMSQRVMENVTVSVSTASQNHTVRVGGTVVKSHVLCILDSIACSNDSLFHHEQENIETS
jgi:hypothetical protein